MVSWKVTGELESDGVTEKLESDGVTHIQIKIEKQNPPVTPSLPHQVT